MTAIDTETIVIDLRGKTLDEVLEETGSRHILTDRDPESLDITKKHTDNGLFVGQGYSYTKVICVYLAPTWEVVGNDIQDRSGPKVEFIIWDGRQVPQRTDCDLHGFVRHDGTIDWGQYRTINLSR